MPDPQKNIEVIWKTLSPKYDLPPLDEFKEKMKNPSNVEKIRQIMSEKYNLVDASGAPIDSATFAKKVGLEETNQESIPTASKTFTAPLGTTIKSGFSVPSDRAFTSIPQGFMGAESSNPSENKPLEAAYSIARKAEMTDLGQSNKDVASKVEKAIRRPWEYVRDKVDQMLGRTINNEDESKKTAFEFQNYVKYLKADQRDQIRSDIEKSNIKDTLKESFIHSLRMDVTPVVTLENVVSPQETVTEAAKQGFNTSTKNYQIGFKIMMDAKNHMINPDEVDTFIDNMYNRFVGYGIPSKSEKEVAREALGIEQNLAGKTGEAIGRLPAFFGEIAVVSASTGGSGSIAQVFSGASKTMKVIGGLTEEAIKMGLQQSVFEGADFKQGAEMGASYFAGGQITGAIFGHTLASRLMVNGLSARAAGKTVAAIQSGTGAILGGMGMRLAGGETVNSDNVAIDAMMGTVLGLFHASPELRKKAIDNILNKSADMGIVDPSDLAQMKAVLYKTTSDTQNFKEVINQTLKTIRESKGKDFASVIEKPIDIQSDFPLKNISEIENEPVKITEQAQKKSEEILTNKKEPVDGKEKEAQKEKILGDVTDVNKSGQGTAGVSEAAQTSILKKGKQDVSARISELKKSGSESPDLKRSTELARRSIEAINEKERRGEDATSDRAELAQVLADHIVKNVPSMEQGVSTGLGELVKNIGNFESKTFVDVMAKQIKAIEDLQLEVKNSDLSDVEKLNLDSYLTQIKTRPVQIMGDFMGLKDVLNSKDWQKTYDEYSKALPNRNDVGNFSGVAERVKSQRGMDFESGKGWTPEEAIVEGKKLLKQGVDPEQIINEFNSDQKLSGSRMAVVHAKANELAKTTESAADKFGVESKEYEDAFRKEHEWLNKVQPMQTEWSKIGAAQQGQTEINTGSFTSMRTELEKITGEPITKKQSEKVKSLSNAIKNIDDAIDKTFNKVKEAIEKETTREETLNITSFPERIVSKLETAANKARERIKARQSTLTSGLDPTELADYSIIGASHIARGIYDFAKWSEKMVSEFGDRIKPHLRSIYDKSKEELKNNVKSDKINPLTDFVGKKGNKFDIKEVRAIWEYAKQNYIDKGEHFVPSAVKTATDLGLSVEQVFHALAQPKTVRKISDDMYRLMQMRRNADRYAKEWLKSQGENVVLEVVKRIPRMRFGLSVLGHGTVFHETHAGQYMFRPLDWGRYAKFIANEFKFTFSSKEYEKAIQYLENDPMYIRAKRFKLEIDPEKNYGDDYQMFGKLFGKIGRAGDRGMFAIKLFRLEQFKHEWNKLSDTQKADPLMGTKIAELVNHSTGAVNVSFGDFGGAVSAAFFAPKLELSRWANLIYDPGKALITIAKMPSGTATPSEILGAKIVAKNAAQIVATALSMLAVNQAILTATGSKNKINITDPTEQDWLRFKIGDKLIDMSGGLISSLQFLSRLGYAAWREQQVASGKLVKRDEATYNIVGKYLRGKLSPFSGDVAEAWFKKDYEGNVLPGSDEIPERGKRRLSQTEYLLNKTPIPASEAFREVLATMRENGMSDVEIKHVIEWFGVVAIASTGTRVLHYEKRPRLPEEIQSIIGDLDRESLRQSYAVDNAITAFVKSGKINGEELIGKLKDQGVDLTNRQTPQRIKLKLKAALIRGESDPFMNALIDAGIEKRIAIIQEAKKFMADDEYLKYLKQAMAFGLLPK